MAARDHRRTSLWRRLVSLAAVYAFVLQSIIVGMAAVPGAAAADGVAGFEICQHSLDGADPSTGTPAQHLADAAHCKFCLSIAHAIAPTPRALPGVAFDVILALSLPTHDSDIQAPPELSNEQPRGPPHEA
jgi:hypothetical protein